VSAIYNDNQNVIYDDFIANFTGSKFNASEWLDLFDNAGAKYFVFVTVCDPLIAPHIECLMLSQKHHDGYALFDTRNTTNRSSVQLGPKRDFLAELFATAKKEKPEMHRGAFTCF
jgi:alpha-L-fucosidase